MTASNRLFIVTGCVLLTIAGMLGAYGLHGLDDSLSDTGRVSWGWAVQMQYYHSLGLILVGVLGMLLGPSWFFRAAGALMIIGVLIFSGLIYAEQTIGIPAALGKIVPTGGSAMMASWLALAIGVLRARN